MNHHTARIRSITPNTGGATPAAPAPTDGYPGISNPGGYTGGGFGGFPGGIPGGFPGGFPGYYNGTGLVPYTTQTPAVPAEPVKSGGGSSFDFKGMFDRVGGIDGIIGTVGKVQKLMGNFQQMAPLAKLLFGSFFAGKAKAATANSGRRRRRRRSNKRYGYRDTRYPRRSSSYRSPSYPKRYLRRSTANRPSSYPRNRRTRRNRY